MQNSGSNHQSIIICASYPLISPGVHYLNQNINIHTNLLINYNHVMPSQVKNNMLNTAQLIHSPQPPSINRASRRVVHPVQQWNAGDVEAGVPHEDATQGTAHGQHGDIMSSLPGDPGGRYIRCRCRLCGGSTGTISGKKKWANTLRKTAATQG